MSGPEMRPDGATLGRDDAEQRLTAWMADVAPGRAPDHAIEAGLAQAVAGRQAPAWLPKVGPKAARRDGPPTRLFMAVGAVGLLALVGGLLAAGGALRSAPTTDDPLLPTEAPAVVNPAPSASPRSVGAPIEQAVATFWVGATREIPAIGSGPFRPVLDFRGGYFELWYDGVTRPLGATITVAGPGRMRFASTVDGVGCTKGDSGTYAYEISPAGRRLTIQPGTDECESRAALLPGTWDSAQCHIEVAICLDSLEPGTHATTLFRARRDASGPSKDWNPAHPSVTYTVPEGWTNPADFTPGYDLEPADFYAEHGESPSSDQLWHGIYLRAQPVPATTPEGCAPLIPVEGVGGSIDAIAAWLAGHPGLHTTQPVTRELGGRPAILVDVRLDPAWTRTGTCPNDPPGVPTVGLFVSGVGGSSDYDWGIYGDERMRLILVDLGTGGVLAVAIDTTFPERWEELLDGAMPIVESFRFSDR